MVDADQHDPKIFRESLGSFGTTTKPGENQLKELQTKIRQGVKHVELHLAGTGKGQFFTQDVPDKYGFEQRRTIMQLAKLNEQTLSVHGSFDVVSFTGLSQQGFDEAQRATSMKEIDETLKFAAETAKQGAVVFHIQGDSVGAGRSEPNLSKEYLDWLKNNKDPSLRKEYDRIQKQYLNESPLNRLFVDNPIQETEVREEFEAMKINPESQERYQKILRDAKKSGRSAWEEYYYQKNIDRIKLSPDLSPLIVVGDKIEQVQRNQEFIDLDVLLGTSKENKLNDRDKEILSRMGIDITKGINIEEFQKASGYFTNGIPRQFRNTISNEEFEQVRKKVLVEYAEVLSNNNNLQAQADEEFFSRFNKTQIDLVKLQKKRLDAKYEMFKSDLLKVEELEKENRRIIDKLDNIRGDSDVSAAARDALKQDISLRNQSIQQIIYNVIGITEYQELARYDEQIAQINRQITDLEKARGNVKSLTDEIFRKNTTAMAHLGIKALSYQLDLKKKSQVAKGKREEFNDKIKEKEKEFNEATNTEDRDRINAEIQKLKYDRRLWVGVEDYKDIDLIDKPLYLAPENMLPGYGSLSSLEEYKATMRIAQEDFAEKILSNESIYKKLREQYEKETGVKISTKEDAVKLAKRHLSGTFDNAHAGAWLKHFKYEVDPKTGEIESDEHRIERFNKWLNSEAESMAKEGLIKHIHFNDTQGKDDDHNLLGSGILDLHDLRDRLRKAGIKEPLIVEAGGRGADVNLHLQHAFEIFNPTLQKEGYSLAGQPPTIGSNVSDWVSVKREYYARPQYSQYGMSYSTFRSQQPAQGQPKGNWTGLGFI